MDTSPKLLAHRLAIGFAVALLCAGGGARAEIAQVPLTLATAVKSNLLLAIDDSGSMDWEVLFPTESGQLHWNFDSDLPVDASGALYRTSQGRAYSYLFPNGNSTGNKVYAVSSGNGQALAPRPEYAFARSAFFNKQYYDTAVTYRPWVSLGANTFTDASSTAALSDPMVPASSTIDLTADLYRTGDNEWAFTTSGGSRGATATGEPGDAVSGGRAYQAYRYFPATYYMPLGGSHALPSWLGSGENCNAPDPQVYRTYVLDWSNANQALLEAAGVDAIGPGGLCLEKFEIRSGNTFPSGRSYADEIQNFANWFQYHRKRHLALRAGMGEALANVDDVYAGSFTINNRTSPTMWDLGVSKAPLYDFLYGLIGNSGTTPNRQALDHAGLQFNRTTDPIISAACQHNFTLLFTDGYANAFDAFDPAANNADGDNGAPFADNHGDTIADIAMYWYERRLRGDLPAGKVPVAAECSTGSPPAHLACNPDLHMRTFGVTLGARGDIFGTTHHSVADAHVAAPGWVTPNGSSDDSRPVQVDDLYHAAVNARGELLNATSTAELSEKLRQALQSILQAGISSASSVSSNSTRLDTNTLVYQARFDSRRWSGELLAFSLTDDGALDEQEWDAGERIPASASRAIYTSNAAGDGIAFEWNELDPAQQAALDRSASGTDDGLGEERLGYLRGVRSQETASGGVFRTRDRVLGDIVNSSPWFVGAQNFGYERLPSGEPGRDSYQAFRLANETRRKMIYVGANDGMLHGFDAETGAERFAYVPSELFPELSELTSPGYRHRYFVDGTPVAGDAYFGGAWRTVLVGSTGAGGRSVFALDVTDPDSFDETKVLWEFTDADLGSVIGRPSIARMANGKWAAVFGSGFGLSRSAKLFVVDLETGDLLAKLSTVRSADEAAAVANGMASPFPVDVGGDTVTEIVYAGDLYGNMWKFDVSASNPNSWGSDFSGGSPAGPQPLITACASGDAAGPFDCPAASRQPITMRPVVGRAPDDGLAVYFGTGKFFETADNTVSGSGPVQSFYGVRDANTQTGSNAGDRIAGRSELVEQEIIAEVEFDEDDQIRVTTQKPIPDDKLGWYMDLVSPVNGFEGERVVAQPLLREGRLIFTTLIPSGDACEAGGSSWLMELSALDGGRFAYPVFDLDGDGEFTDDDMVTITDADGNEILVAPSGRRSGVGVIQTPAIIEAGAVEYKITGGSSGGIESIRERGRLSKGRNSWRQLWPGQ